MDVRLITDEGVEDRPVSELVTLLGREDSLIWVDIPRSDAQAVRVLSEVFGFHPTAVRDCVEGNGVHKARVYADHVFVVLPAPDPGEHDAELGQFIGWNYLVTVHGPPGRTAGTAPPETHEVLDRIQTGRLRPSTPYDLSCAIVSSLSRSR